jgi:predicted nucleotidyltransferase
MNGQEIMDFLQEKKSYLKKEFGVLSIGLFGSYANGTQGPNSDVDFLVELKEPRFDYLAGLQLYLEDSLGKPVELVRKRSSLNERFIKRIKTQIHYA